jgi:hypothetical protein
MSFAATRCNSLKLFCQPASVWGPYPFLLTHTPAHHNSHTQQKMKRTAEELIASAKVIKLVEKTCGKCGIVKECVSEFHKNKSTKDGLSEQCRSCYNMRKTLHRNTYDGHCQTLLDTSRGSTRTRNKKGRGHQHAITKEYILQLPKLCHYTRVPLAFSPHSDFAASLERLNNNIGYVPGNAVLCCAELNTASQITPTKVAQLFTSQLHDGIVFTDADFSTEEKKPAQYKWVVDADGNVYCHNCQTIKPRSEFYSNLSYGCRLCVQYNRRSTWWKVSRMLHTNAQIHSKNGRVGKTFNITQQDIINQLVKQKGLCYYSRYPLTKTGDYKASLERLNPLLGYEKGNIVLIIAEFNSFDRTSVKTKNSNKGSAGMSRRKFLHMLRHVLAENDYEEYIFNTGED